MLLQIKEKQNDQNVVMLIDLADLCEQKDIKQVQETLKNKENSLYDIFHESKFAEDTEINRIKGIAMYKGNIHRHILY
ncbi:DNA-directed RNA polymerase specialized sigma54-like protein [Bartonella japonica]|uniref:DNA-directed RNA polymerase specialized sigma54-like protein n=1 Tax=Bartonella japonica TaxID=357761 RepID=A0ABV2FP97_9HYPH